MTTLIPGKVVKVKGGTYDGQAASIKKIGPKKVVVCILGRYVELRRERVEHGEA